LCQTIYVPLYWNVLRKAILILLARPHLTVAFDTTFSPTVPLLSSACGDLQRLWVLERRNIGTWTSQARNSVGFYSLRSD
jgi:hypothetical protein